jgi:hypothetical protein
MIPLPQFGYFPQGVFDPAIRMVDFVGFLLLDDFRPSFQFFGSGSQRMEFVLVGLLNLGGSLF